MPTAATRLGGSPSVVKLPVNCGPATSEARTASPIAISGLAPNLPSSIAVTPTMKIMMATVVGSSAAPLGNAPWPRSCWR
ncbi:hypothetical protein [Nonomuraea sp. NPDC052265]|uniref:hypothetical protein n=1 Tax=Nonomuraea sp. NPDC052265 TaxID=3364374 RepID=UPI0037C70704